MVRWLEFQGRRVLTVVASCFIVSGCWLVHRVVVEEVRRPADSVRVATPVKAHLLGGHTVIYAAGVTLARDSLFGTGTRYDLRLQPVGPAGTLPLDSVLGMESFRRVLDAGTTIAYSTLSVAGTIGLGVAIACAADPKCFGSCPTFYSDSAGAEVLQAEGFSYSIAPLFEARDVDRLRAQADSDGVLRLEVRNEAYETHYLNQLALLEARHAADEVVVPDGQGHLVAVRDLTRPAAARDRRHRDVRAELQVADGRVMQTDDRTLAAARSGDLEDTVELEFPVPPGATSDSAALLFRMRNSLLNTVLLYDVMLGDAGARSLDWQAGDLERVGPALQLGQWYASHLGMKIAVWQHGAWMEAAHLRDTGPVAWKDIAAVVPLPPGKTLRVRLTYVVDNWRIDRVSAGFSVRRPVAQVRSVSEVLDAAGAADTAALASLLAADQRYLQTTSGQRFSIGWRIPGAPRDSMRTFFLVSQGYYIEWIRRGWLAQPRRGTTFMPDDNALAEAVARYREVRDTLERSFRATRVPVR